MMVVLGVSYSGIGLGVQDIREINAVTLVSLRLLADDNLICFHSTFGQILTLRNCRLILNTYAWKKTRETLAAASK